MTFCNINEWLLYKLFTKQNLVLKQQVVSDKLMFSSGDVFIRSLYSSRGLSMSLIATVFLLAKSSHFLLRIIPAVRTFSSHFTGLPFRSLQITKAHLRKCIPISNWINQTSQLSKRTEAGSGCGLFSLKISCSIQQSSCYTCYTEDSCRPAIIDSCQKQLSQISFHTLSFQKI